MPFREVRLDPDDPNSHPRSYRWVRSTLRHPVSEALVDDERGYAFYRISVQHSEERPPGLCLLFLGDRPPVVIKVYEQYTRPGEGLVLTPEQRDRAGDGMVLTVLLDSIEIPDGIPLTKFEALEIAREAYWADAERNPREFRPARIQWVLRGP